MDEEETISLFRGPEWARDESHAEEDVQRERREALRLALLLRYGSPELLRCYLWLHHCEERESERAVSQPVVRSLMFGRLTRNERHGPSPSPDIDDAAQDLPRAFFRRHAGWSRGGRGGSAGGEGEALLNASAKFPASDDPPPARARGHVNVWTQDLASTFLSGLTAASLVAHEVQLRLVQLPRATLGVASDSGAPQGGRKVISTPSASSPARVLPLNGFYLTSIYLYEPLSFLQ